jgi:hypothetical protein
MLKQMPDEGNRYGIPDYNPNYGHQCPNGPQRAADGTYPWVESEWHFRYPTLGEFLFSLPFLESHYDPLVRNSSDHVGLYQYDQTTWDSNNVTPGADRTNWQAQVLATKHVMTNGSRCEYQQKWSADLVGNGSGLDWTQHTAYYNR